MYKKMIEDLTEEYEKYEDEIPEIIKIVLRPQLNGGSKKKIKTRKRKIKTRKRKTKTRKRKIHGGDNFTIGVFYIIVILISILTCCNISIQDNIHILVPPFIAMFTLGAILDSDVRRRRLLQNADRQYEIDHRRRRRLLQNADRQYEIHHPPTAANIPTVANIANATFSEIEIVDDEIVDDECSICLDNLSGNIIITLHCEVTNPESHPHSFHTNCMNRHLSINRTRHLRCPLCNEPITFN
jgi:hypothetical protein